MKKTEEIIQEGFRLIEEGDGLITITQAGLEKAITLAILELEKDTAAPLEARLKTIEGALKELLDHLFLNGVDEQDEWYLKKAKQALEGGDDE